MHRKKLTLGLFGFGCVGTGLYEVLQKTPGLKSNIKRICVKDKYKTRGLTAEHFTFDRNEILNDEEINVVVELIDDADAAFEIVCSALKKGKAVVTANKKMIAEHFTELLVLQKMYKTPLLYEASCCASIPIIRNLEEYYDTDLLESIEGIVNGSTNYILTKINKEGLSFTESLKLAQENGYAETDPILDTGGFDAKYKLLILIAHAFGLVLTPEQITNVGIEGIGEMELNYAREKGLKIKLIAHAEKSLSGSIAAFVLPKFISKDDKFYSIDDVFNGVKTKSCFSDVQFFVGKGAGAHPTASAVLSDLSALTYNYQYEYKKLKGKEQLESTETILLKVFVRYAAELTSLLKNSFLEIEESFLKQKEGYIVGVMSLATLSKIIAKSGRKCSFVLVEKVKRPVESFRRQEPEIELREVFM